jgi:hypothetical protein
MPKASTLPLTLALSVPINLLHSRRLLIHSVGPTMHLIECISPQGCRTMSYKCFHRGRIFDYMIWESDCLQPTFIMIYHGRLLAYLSESILSAIGKVPTRSNNTYESSSMRNDNLEYKYSRKRRGPRPRKTRHGSQRAVRSMVVSHWSIMTTSSSSSSTSWMSRLRDASESAEEDSAEIPRSRPLIESSSESSMIMKSLA